MSGGARGRSEVARPGFAPVCWFAVALWTGASLAEEAWWRARSDPRAPALALAIAGACVLLGLEALRRWPGARRIGTIALCGVALGATLSYTTGVRLSQAGWALSAAGARTWRGVVVADPTEGRYGARVNVRLGPGPGDGALVSIAWPARAATPAIGQTVAFRALLAPPPASDAFLRDDLRGGICATGRAWSAGATGWSPGVKGWLLAWRARQSAWLATRAGPGAALLRGIALGDRRSLHGGAVEDDFRVLGLSHVLAVSGLHLGLVCALALGLAHLLRLPGKMATLACVAAGGAFAVVTGAPASALRALSMVSTAALASLVGVRRDGVASLAVAASVLVLAAPWSVFSVGLRLSVLAVGGLLVFGSLAGAWAGACRLGMLQRPAELMSLTVVAQLTTAVVCIPTFGMFSLLAPVANAVVLPSLPVALGSGLAGLALRGGPLDALGRVALAVSMGVLGAIAWITDALSAAPGAAIAVGGGATALGLGSLAVCGALWACWPLPRSRGAARSVAAAVVGVTLMAAIGPPVPLGASITALDIGQGDAILVRDGSHALLVDTGPSPSVLRQALARHGIRRIDGVIITHEHDDHVAGLSGLAGVVRVGWVGVSCESGARFVASVRQTAQRLSPRGRVRVQVLKAGETLALGRTSVRVLWPRAGDPLPEKTNDTSLVLSLSRGAFHAVLTGDSESTAQLCMLQAGLLHRVDVLKVAHHGSENGLCAETLAVWRPAVALISVGAGNRFGHPHAVTLRLLEHAGARIYRTDTHGDITVRIGAHGFTVSARPLCENRAMRYCAPRYVCQRAPPSRTRRTWPSSNCATSRLST